jgi:hypothetical protein
MAKPIDLGDVAANPSGAPEAGGATTAASSFGGDSYWARLLRLLARIARDLEATAYRRLRDMEKRRGRPGPGSPNRVKRAQRPR